MYTSSYISAGSGQGLSSANLEASATAEVALTSISFRSPSPATPVLDDVLVEPVQTVLASVVLLLLGGPVLRRVVGAEVAEVPVRHRLDQRRPLARPGARHRLPAYLVHLKRVLAVGHDAGYAIPVRPVRHRPARYHVLGGRRLGVTVVLTHEDDRQLPYAGQVQGLVKAALAGRPVAEEDDAHAVHARGAGR